jgi:multimeric flavodoxin WrbA
MYGHVAKLAQAEKKGIEEAGGKVDVYQYVYSHCCWSAELTLP